MTPFQVGTLALLGGLLAAEAVGFARRRTDYRLRTVRALVWLGAALAIAHPEGVQWLATAVGIHRGADLVAYLFVLAFLVIAFRLYAGQVQLERQVTLLVRALALREARRGPEPPDTARG